MAGPPRGGTPGARTPHGGTPHGGTPGAGTPGGGLPRGGPQSRTAQISRLVLREPFTRRSRNEFAHCAAGVLLGPPGFAVTVVLLLPGVVASATVAGTFIGLLLVIAVLSFARWAGSVHRLLAGALLGEQIVPPPPFRPGRGVLNRLDARLRDGPGWRAVAYLLVKLPLAVADGYAVVFWLYGLRDLLAPLWWEVGGSHPEGPAHPRTIALLPFGSFHVVTWAGTIPQALTGAVLVLAAPWVTRVVVTADRRLVRSLLGPGGLVTSRWPSTVPTRWASPARPLPRAGSAPPRPSSVTSIRSTRPRSASCVLTSIRIAVARLCFAALASSSAAQK